MIGLAPLRGEVHGQDAGDSRRDNALWSRREIWDQRVGESVSGIKFSARVFAVAFSTAALIGAAQLGLVFGFNAMLFDRNFSGAENDWSIQLTWIAWFAMTAVVGGTAFGMSHSRLLARRQGLASRHTDGIGITVRIVTSIAAALGSLLAVAPVTVYQAVNAKLPATFYAPLTMALTVAGAVVAGMVLAGLTAGIRPLSTSMLWFVIVAWVLAAVSLLSTTPLMGLPYLEPARLGVLDIGALRMSPRAHFTMPVLALALGAILAMTAWIRRHSRILIALSGATGPLLIALAYLMGGPGITRDLTNQADAYVGAMISVVVGLVPAVIVALLPKRRWTQL